MVSEWIKMLLVDFSAAMFYLAIIFIIIHKLIVGRRVPNAEIIYRWIALFPLGFVGVYTFIMHAFYPNLAAESIGWQVSPFQFEVAVADLALGVLGILSFRASYDFRLATVIASLVMLWGDAIGHEMDFMRTFNLIASNTGSWFLTDIFVPLILALCILKLRPGRHR